jgi:hypothetical protein
MSQTKLRVVLRPGKDGLVVAEAPAIPGCAAEASTVEEALAKIREAAGREAATPPDAAQPEESNRGRDATLPLSMGVRRERD